MTTTQQERLEKRVNDLFDGKKKASLLELIDLFGYDHVAEKTTLKRELETLKSTLKETFDCNGTQAILVEHGDSVVLAFRGTEATSVKDIKTDMRAKMIRCTNGGRVHQGFYEAFTNVWDQINAALSSEAVRDKPLFLTGHSLGGALATIAAKKLVHQGGIAACYTFGSPRVGDDEWIAGMKVPVYRLVNAADGITMLPPSTTFMVAMCWIVHRIPYIGEAMRSCLSKFGGYIHCGNMRYLTNCPKGDYGGVKLLYSVSFLYRMKGFLINQLPLRVFLADHSINVYWKKLMVVAETRNP